jgi:hypothetical protein
VIRPQSSPLSPHDRNRPSGGPPSYERGVTAPVEAVPAVSNTNWEDRQRGRSHPRSLRILVGCVLIGLSWVSLIYTIVTLGLRHLHPGERWNDAPVIGLVVFAVTFFGSLIAGGSLKCPLCHGPVLHSRHCRKHRLANHLPPFTYRATLVLRVLFSLSFRCMYCGTPFRLFKKSSSSRH